MDNAQRVTCVILREPSPLDRDARERVVAVGGDGWRLELRELIDQLMLGRAYVVESTDGVLPVRWRAAHGSRLFPTTVDDPAQDVLLRLPVCGG